MSSPCILKQIWFCISSIKHRNFQRKWRKCQLPLLRNSSHGLACCCVKSDNYHLLRRNSGNLNDQACLSCMLSFNIPSIFTSGFSALVDKIQCHRKTLEKPCMTCSSAERCIGDLHWEWCHLCLTVGKSSRIVDLLRGSAEGLCSQAALPCSAAWHPSLGGVSTVCLPCSGSGCQRCSCQQGCRLLLAWHQNKGTDREQRRFQHGFE